jgi:3'(2'), 5'-bisphosphate nucleotidase
MKAIQIASGAFDMYVHPGPSGMLWDSCAPEAIVRAAGGLLTDARGGEIDYRRPTLHNVGGVLAANATLHALALEKLGAEP